MPSIVFVVCIMGCMISAGHTFADPLDLKDTTAVQCAHLLRGLDRAAEAVAAGMSGYDALRDYLHANRRHVGRAILGRMRHLVLDDSDGSRIGRLIDERDRFLLESRSSPLFQALAIPHDLSEPPTDAAEIALWSGEGMAAVRRQLVRHTGLDDAVVLPGPALAASLRAALLEALADGHPARAERIRASIRRAAHTLRAHRGHIRLATAAATAPDDDLTWPHARQDEGLDDLILGGLVYLDDTQIRDRLGRLTATITATDAGDGATSRFVYNSLFSERSHELPLLIDVSVRNHEGQWASFIHFLPKLWERFSVRGRAKFGVLQDSNLFTTAFVTYPMHMVDDPTGIVDDMLDDAMVFMESCRRGPAYAFWPRLPEDISPHDIIGPPNTPYWPVGLLGRILINPRVEAWVRSLPPKRRHMSMDTIKEFMDPRINPAGAEAVVNIPPDADDTAVAVAAQYLLDRRRQGLGGWPVDTDALVAMSQFRDLDRTKEHEKDAWKGMNSGGYLTWIRDEEEPTLSDPSLGFIPLEVNNVDSVVQANALFSLTLTGNTHLPGYDDCRVLVERVALERLWPESAEYYPQLLIFPYVASRAYRDAGARQGRMREAMGRILLDVLDLQYDEGARRVGFPRDVSGSFRGDPDRSVDVATALGCITLMNIGEEVAKELGVLERYREALRRGIAFLKRRARPYDVRDPSTFHYAPTRPQGYVWSEGIFFSSGSQAMAYWRSEPYSVAMVLEALIKYRLGYDRHDHTLVESPRIRLLPPSAGVTGSWRLGVAGPVGGR